MWISKWNSKATVRAFQRYKLATWGVYHSVLMINHCLESTVENEHATQFMLYKLAPISSKRAVIFKWQQSRIETIQNVYVYNRTPKVPLTFIRCFSSNSWLSVISFFFFLAFPLYMFSHKDSKEEETIKKNMKQLKETLRTNL